MNTHQDLKVVQLVSGATSCQDCRLQELCLAQGLDDQDMGKLDHIVRHRRPLTRGEHLFRAGDAFRSIFVLKSGSLKTYSSSEDGAEQVTGFHLPGDVVGLDAIAIERHYSSAEALETTSVCEIPFRGLEALCETAPGVHRKLIRAMSREILGDEAHLGLLGQKSAEVRLATLLLNFADRFEQRGFSAQEFNLSMSRTEIGNYLGLAMETVSRLFKRLQELGLIDVDRKLVRINDVAALQDFTKDSHEGFGSRASA